MALRSDRRLKQASKVFLDRHTLSLPPLLPALRLPEAVTACRCVWLGVVAAVWGLNTFCVCVECVHLFVCGFKCLVLDVCLRVNLFVRDFFFSN